MKKIVWMFVLMIWAGSVATGSAGNKAQPLTLEEAVRQIQALPWEYEPIEYDLPKSHSDVSLPEGFILVRGTAAEQFMYLNQGIQLPGIEAVMFHPETISQLIFSYHNVGYVSLESWRHLNADKILKRISTMTEKDNDLRKDRGLEPGIVMGWIQEPVLDKETETVHWIFQLKEGPQVMVNAVVIKLGRNGFERIIWVAPYTVYQESQGLIPDLIASHHFQPTYRYADRGLKDQMAEFGISSLVTAITGN